MRRTNSLTSQKKCCASWLRCAILRWMNSGDDRMAKSFVELIRDDIRRARAGENILTEEPCFVLVPDDHGTAQTSARAANTIPVSKSAFSRLTRLAKKHKMDVSKYMEQLVAKAK